MIQYKRLDDGPIDDMKELTNPLYLMEEEGMEVDLAIAEAARFRKLVEDYFKGKWWFVEIHAWVAVMDSQGHTHRVVAPVDHLESNWPVEALRYIEDSQLATLKDQVSDLYVSCKKFHVHRDGTQNLQHGYKLQEHR